MKQNTTSTIAEGRDDKEMEQVRVYGIVGEINIGLYAGEHEWGREVQAIEFKPESPELHSNEWRFEVSDTLNYEVPFSCLLFLSSFFII